MSYHQSWLIMPLREGATQGYFRKYSERQGNRSFSILAYNPVFEIQFENGVLYQNGQVIDRDPWFPL